jgi:hypothetical protein
MGYDAGNLAVEFIAKGLQRASAFHYLLPQEANQAAESIQAATNGAQGVVSFLSADGVFER